MKGLPMFKKLRIQFVAIVMTSVAIVLAIVFSGICITEYQHSKNDVNEAMDMAINRAGEKPFGLGRFGTDEGLSDNWSTARKQTTTTVVVRKSVDVEKVLTSA